MDYFAHRISRADLVNGVVILHFTVIKPDKDGNYNPEDQPKPEDRTFTVNLPLQGFMRSMTTMRELVKELQERGVLKTGGDGEGKEGEASEGGELTVSSRGPGGPGGRGPGGQGQRGPGGGGRGPGGPGGPGGGGRGPGGPGGQGGPGGRGRGPGGPGGRAGGPERPRMRDITNEDDSSEPLV